MNTIAIVSTISSCGKDGGLNRLDEEAGGMEASAAGDGTAR